jgi:flagellar basal-body rod protein FlgC
MAGISNNQFDMGARALSAQLVRLNTITSNIANAGAVSGSEEKAYRAMKPVFEAKYADDAETSGVATVDVVDIQKSQKSVPRLSQPGHPLADKDGFIYLSNVDVPEELVDMMETSRQYQNTTEALNTMKSLTMQTLRLGT